MTVNKKTLDLILGLFFLSLFLFSFYYLIFVWAPENTTVAIPLFTACIGLIGIIYAQYQSKSRDIAESHRESKIETYRMFFNILKLFMNKDNGEIDINDKKIQNMMRELNENFILWASDDVLVAWKEFREHGNDNKQVLKKVDNMYRAIRKDLGHTDKKLKELD
ncbi:TPA: hypothetical protein QB320_001585, partial [Pasteurella multocida]|nr:hypothetical protein [Pasteurella multocida]